MQRNIQQHKARMYVRSSENAEPGFSPDRDDTFLENTDLEIPGKQSITIRIDVDVLDWFKRQGRGYQTRINKLLRSYMEARKNRLNR